MNECAEIPLPGIRIGSAWCIYIGSLSLSHLCCVLALALYYLKEHWNLKWNNVWMITPHPTPPSIILGVCMLDRWGGGGGVGVLHHIPGSPHPAVKISGHSPSSKILPPPLTFLSSRWHNHLRWSGYIMMQHISHAVFALQMKKLSKFVGDESASFIDSSFICVQSKPSFHGAVANEGANKLSPRRHYGVFIWICLMFHPLVIWALFHVHHQKDIKQDVEFKIRSQSKKCDVCVLTGCSLYIHLCVCVSFSKQEWIIYLQYQLFDWLHHALAWKKIK